MIRTLFPVVLGIVVVAGVSSVATFRVTASAIEADRDAFILRQAAICQQEENLTAKIHILTTGETIFVDCNDNRHLVFVHP
jgi:hypothetical protein